MSLRTDLIAYLTELLPTVDALADVKLIPTVRAVDELSKPVLIVKTDSIQKLPQAPRLKYQGIFTLTLVSQHRDLDLAETQLEGLLESLLPSLFTWGLNYTSADQVQFSESYIAYDIHVTSIYTRED